MKKIFSKMMAVSLVFLGTQVTPSSVSAQTEGQMVSAAKKILVVYYSYSGNTREVAKEIQKQTGADLFEIETETAYPPGYDDVVDQAKKEISAGYKPAIKAKIPNIEEYDVVFLGSPSWWATAAPPVMTFLGEHNLAGKSIAPFITHAGTGLGRYATDVAKAAPESTMLKSASFWGRNAKTSQNEISKWISDLKL